jgi:DHA3 family tetracycline resistance protein-like MFS transporter
LSIIVGYIMIGMGFVLEGLVPRFEAVLLAQVLWGMGYTFTSGATEAWIADEIGEQNSGAAYMRAAQVGQLTAVAGTLLGIVLGSAQINLPVVVGGTGVSLIGLCLILVMPEQGFNPRPRGERSSFQHMLQTARDGAGMVRRRPALLTILAIGAVFGAFSEGYDRLLTAHMLEDFTFPDFGGFQPIVWLGAFGIANKLLSAGVIAWLRRRIDTNSHQAVARALFVFYAVLSAAVVAIGLAGSFWIAVVTMSVAGLARRISDPLYTAWVNQRIDPQVRATVISLSSQANAFGQIAGGPAVGAIGTVISLRAALVTAGLLLAPVLGLVRYTALNHERALPGMVASPEAADG